MYLKFECKLELLAIGRLLSPGTPDDTFGWVRENVYERIHVNIQGLNFSLSVSREHGLAELGNELLGVDNCLTNAEIHKLVKPGPVYVFGWNGIDNEYVDALPPFLASYIADRLSVDVFVYSQRIDVDLPDPEPTAVVKPAIDRGD